MGFIGGGGLRGNFMQSIISNFALVAADNLDFFGWSEVSTGNVSSTNRLTIWGGEGAAVRHVIHISSSTTVDTILFTPEKNTVATAGIITILAATSGVFVGEIDEPMSIGDELNMQMTGYVGAGSLNTRGRTLVGICH